MNNTKNFFNNSYWPIVLFAIFEIILTGFYFFYLKRNYKDTTYASGSAILMIVGIIIICIIAALLVMIGNYFFPCFYAGQGLGTILCFIILLIIFLGSFGLFRKELSDAKYYTYTKMKIPEHIEDYISKERIKNEMRTDY